MEYPVAMVVLTDTFEVGDNIVPYDSAINKYLHFFSALELDKRSKSNQGKQFLKIVWNIPLEETKEANESTTRCMLRHIKPNAFFSYQGIKYKKSARILNSKHCPKYIGIQENNVTVYGIIPRNTDGTYSEVAELFSWMSENTHVTPEI